MPAATADIVLSPLGEGLSDSDQIQEALRALPADGVLGFTDETFTLTRPIDPTGLKVKMRGLKATGPACGDPS